MADNKKNLIISELETMEQGDIIRGEKFSALAYRKVINGLRPLEASRASALRLRRRFRRFLILEA